MSTHLLFDFLNELRFAACLINSIIQEHLYLILITTLNRICFGVNSQCYNVQRLQMAPFCFKT